MAITEKIDNGDFEVGWDGSDPNIPSAWTGRSLQAADLSRVQAGAASGSNHVKFNSTAEGGDALYQLIHLRAGSVYTVTYWQKKSSVDLTAIRIVAASAYPSKTVVPMSVPLCATDTTAYASWTAMSHTLTATNTIAHYFDLYYGGGAQVWEIDAISVKDTTWGALDEASTTWGGLDAASTTWGTFDKAQDYGGFGHAPHFGYYSPGFGHGYRGSSITRWDGIDKVSTTWGEIDKTTTSWSDI